MQKHTTKASKNCWGRLSENSNGAKFSPVGDRKIEANSQCNSHFTAENSNKNGIESHWLLVFGQSGGGKIAGDTKKFAEYKVQLLKALCKPEKGNKILDFGCGIGRSLFYLEQYLDNIGVELYGCDVSYESLKIAAKAVPNATLFLNTPIENLENFNADFDIVLCACVLHHIDPAEREILEQ